MLNFDFGTLAMVLLSALIGYSAYRLLEIKEKQRKFWKNLGVKHVEKKVPLFQDVFELIIKRSNETYLERRKKYGKIYGDSNFGRNRLVITDPEVVRQICIKDFDCFPDRVWSNFFSDYMKNSLIWIKGDHWKRVRAMMTPTFTSGKMRRMYKLMDGCADDMVANFSEQYEMHKASGQCQVDLIKLYGLYTIDGISTCCYGIKLKREHEASSDDLSTASRESFIKMSAKMLSINKFKLLIALIPSSLRERFDIRLISSSDLQALADRVQMMIDIRRGGREGSAKKYDDLLQLLVDAKLDDELELNEMDQKENHHAGLTHNSLVEDQAKLKASVTSKRQQISLSDFEILCQAMLLLSAGFDTTRASLSTITFILAHNPEVQEKLHEVIKSIAQFSESSNGEKFSFDYEALTSCEYLDAVICESLRFFSPVLVITRETQRDYFIEKYKVHVPKGMSINIGLYAMHMDPDYWQEPERFDPERFLPGQKENIVPGSYAPFSMGPRHCIGMRFSLTETKLGLAKAVMNFKFEPAPGTIYPPKAGSGIAIMTVKDCRVIITPRRRHF